MPRKIEEVGVTDCRIEAEDLSDQILGQLVWQGLQAVFLCFFGRSRSREGAETFNEMGVPAVYIGEGLNKLPHDPCILAQLAQVPMVFCLLTPEDKQEAMSILQRLNTNCRIYYVKDQAEAYKIFRDKLAK